MTVHAIQGYVAPDSGMTESEVQTAVDDWVAARTKWSEDDYSTTVTRENTELDDTGTDYLRFAVRFEWSADKDNTLQKCADKFKNKVAWFSLVYHVCYHDETEPQPCSWNERWNWDDGSGIPTDVDSLIPDAPTVVNA